MPVVAKHVETGAGRRQQHRVAGHAARCAAATASSIDATVSVAHTPCKRGRNGRRILADQHGDSAPCRESLPPAARSPVPCPRRRRSSPEGPACPRPPRWSLPHSCPWNHRHSARRAISATHDERCVSPGKDCKRLEHRCRGQTHRLAQAPAPRARWRRCAFRRFSCAPYRAVSRRGALRKTCAPLRNSEKSLSLRSMEKVTVCAAVIAIAPVRASPSPTGSSAFSTTVGGLGENS